MNYPHKIIPYFIIQNTEHFNINLKKIKSQHSNYN